MFSSFRLSMTWLHTWFGLVLGFVLMAVFFFGSLSVFDREIDRWALPETRFAPQPMPSFDALLEPIYRQMRAHPDDMKATAQRVHGEIPHPDTLALASVYAYTTHRDPVLDIGGEFNIPNKPIDASDEHQHVHGWLTIDPRDGTVLSDDKLKIGTDFFYPMHFHLHLDWKDLGYWIVGLAALVMLAALVSGIVMHRKLFCEMFTFRPGKKIQRSTLDLHNLTGVVALPFHFMFALSGLIIFAGIYLPVNDTVFKPVAQAFEKSEAARTGLPHEPAGVAAKMAPVDPMIAEAQRRWAERGMAREVGYLTVDHIDDANAYVGVYRATTDRVDFFGNGIYFSGTTGEVIYEEPPQSAVKTVEGFVEGLHFQHFRHWLLRWLYFIGGLAGCACIATGFIFFVEKRKKQHAARCVVGSRVVDALAVTTVTGMLIATFAMLVFNRLLPTDLPRRGDWEEYLFWATWLVTMAHAFWRTAPVLQARIAPAWREQCWAVATLAVAAVLLNWLTTGDHLLRSLGLAGDAVYWPVAGIDLTLLAASALAIIAARKLSLRERGLHSARSTRTQDTVTAESGAGVSAAAKVSHG